MDSPESRILAKYERKFESFREWRKVATITEFSPRDSLSGKKAVHNN